MFLMGNDRMADVHAEVLKDRRRIAILRVPAQMVFTGLLGATVEGGEAKTWRTEGVPADALVVSVHYDIDRDCFMFRLWHRSFAIVDEACQCPELNLTVHQLALPMPAENAPLVSVLSNSWNRGF